MRQVKMLAIAILMPLLSVKIAHSQPPVKQYIAVDVEVFEEMQRTATQLRNKLKEIERLEEQMSVLRRELETLKATIGADKAEEEEDEDEDF